ncbi:hypothetical protein [Roseateles sp.]|uniref:hypothetical protein n=1 Tax=Roseateles sp. TaxID=1971397 RepID=UPI0031CE1E6A
MSESPIAWPSLPKIVQPLVRRHAEDAAFYWTQLDGASQATGLNAQRLIHFQRLLEAHLEGLRVAGIDGMPLTQEALVRWRKPGEAFAACAAALSISGGAEARAYALEPLLRTIRQLPDVLLRGFISALAWTDAAQVEPWLRGALVSDDPVLRVAALRACSLHGLRVERWHLHAHHQDAHVRAAACRAAGPEHLRELATLRDDADLQVRAESAIAWARLMPEGERRAEDAAQAASLLWRCVSEQIELTETRSGWYRMQAQRRLNRWLCHLAWLAPLGHAGVPQLLAQLPPRLALSFLLHHGDAAQLKFVVQATGQPAVARWALWVWRCLTGVDPQVAGLTLPDAPPDLDAPLSTDQRDADQGLPLPDVAAVAAHPGSHIVLEVGERLLMGQPVRAHALRTLLDPAADQPQALRFVAAHALTQLHPAYALNVRASPAVQAAQLARMGVAP